MMLVVVILGNKEEAVQKVLVREQLYLGDDRRLERTNLGGPGRCSFLAPLR